jgi:acid stress-induced BolA-like protein IbaG/YrbA
LEEEILDAKLSKIDEKCEEINKQIDIIGEELEGMERVGKQCIFITLCQMFKKSRKTRNKL